LSALLGSGGVIALGGGIVLVLGAVMARSLRARNGKSLSPIDPL
jgi:hypothetical protein